MKSSAKTIATTDPKAILIGSIVTPTMCVMMLITPTITAPAAVQRAFDITAGVKIRTSKVAIELVHTVEADKPMKYPVV